MNEWEVIMTEKDAKLSKVKVPGGWIYQSVLIYETDIATAMSFVPEPDKCNKHNSHCVKICIECVGEEKIEI